MDWGEKRDYIAGFFSTELFLISLVNYLPEVTELTRKIMQLSFTCLCKYLNQRVIRIGE